MKEVIDELNRKISIACGFLSGFAFGAAILKEQPEARVILVVVGILMAGFAYLAYKETKRMEN
jgi:uncharacterized membrane protein (Fun14 family)